MFRENEVKWIAQNTDNQRTNERSCNRPWKFLMIIVLNISLQVYVIIHSICQQCLLNLRKWINDHMKHNNQVDQKIQAVKVPIVKWLDN